MDNISAWLAGLAWPLVSRVIAALGIGTVTYTGVSATVTSALDTAKNAFGGLAGEVATLLAMSGFFEAMSIGAGGLVSGMAWMVLKQFALKVGT